MDAADAGRNGRRPLFPQENCATCHNVTGDTPKAGPNLLNTGKRHDADWLMAHFKPPSTTSPNTTMTPVALSDAALKDLLALMLKLTPENKMTEPVNSDRTRRIALGRELQHQRQEFLELRVAEVHRRHDGARVVARRFLKWAISQDASCRVLVLSRLGPVFGVPPVTLWQLEQC